MSNFPEFHIDLVNNIEDNISLIQSSFDKYQNECFDSRSPEFFCLELNGEAGELANLEKKLWKGKQIDINNLSDEAADVFIALLNYCNARGINLEKAVINKLKIIENKRVYLKSIGERY